MVVEGCTVRRFAMRDAAAGRNPMDDWLYSLAWRRQERPEPAPPSLAPAIWLVFAGTSGLGDMLASELAARGDRCVRVVPGQDYRRLNSDHYQINPTQPEGFRSLLKEIFPQGQGRTPLHGVVYLWSLDIPTILDAGKEASAVVTAACTGLLYLTQALAQAGWRDAPRLWLVTRGAQAVEPGQGASALAGSSVSWFRNT